MAAHEKNDKNGSIDKIVTGHAASVCGQDIISQLCVWPHCLKNKKKPPETFVPEGFSDCNALFL